MSAIRIALGTRLLLVLCGLAAFSVLVAVVLQGRALSERLELAGRQRLDAASRAVEQLVEDHLHALRSRYYAISRTPEFRANLEVDHAPTLAYYANRLVAQEGAAFGLFADRAGRARAHSGDESWVELALQQLASPSQESCEPEVPGAAGPEHSACAFIVSRAGSPYVGVRMPLSTAGKLVGFLVVFEPLSADSIQKWSELVGARVTLGAGETAGAHRLARTLRAVGDLSLQVAMSVEAEQQALATARARLLTAAVLAIAAAFAVSLVLARGLVRPLRGIQRAALRIGRGELSHRVDLDRNDEFGDLASAFNQMLDQLGQAQGRLSRASRLARLGSWVLDLASGELECSDECRRIYGIPPDQEGLAREAMLFRVHPDDREAVTAVIDACASAGTPFRMDHRVIEPDGDERIVHTHGERITASDGAARIDGTIQDITDRKLAEDQIRYLAYHDSLTGLGNRRLFKESLDLHLKEARLNDSMVGLLFLDIDDFKVINDTLGHTVGDQLLKEMAERLVRSVRTSIDAVHVGPREETASVLARPGGDEFTVLLSGISDPASMGEIAERILNSIAEPFHVADLDVVVSGSIGITVWPLDGDDVESLISNSDTAMYAAKRRARNSYEFYAESMTDAITHRLNMRSKLRRAIEHKEFELHYQPKVELETGRIAGVEALVRWRDPEAGAVPPSEFIGLAEESGFIVAIGEWVLRTAAQQVKTWHDAGLPPVRVAVNLSPHQIEDPGFIDSVQAILAETAAPAELLELEITESTLMQDEEGASNVLQRLSDLGISLALDDFGTGYSSLSYLRRLPIHTLKIDRSFVSNVHSEADDAALVGAIISMAKVLRLRVVVEGVETDEQREILHELGCDEIQGYLFSAPLPTDEITVLLEGPTPWAKPKKVRKAPAARRRAKKTSTGQVGAKKS